MGKYSTYNIFIFVTVAFAIALLNTIPIFAPGGNATMSNTTTTTEEHGEEYTEGISGQGFPSLLQDLLLPAQDFIHLYDSPVLIQY